jgi:hypothetical protein
MASMNLRSYLCRSGVLLTLLLGLVASCKSSPADKVDAGQRKYCLNPDAGVDKGSGAVPETGNAVEAGGGALEVSVDSTGSLDAPNARADSVAVASADAHGDGEVGSTDTSLADTSLAEVAVDMAGAGGSSGTGGATGTGATGGGTGTGATGGAIGTGGSSGADASVDIARDISAGSDAKDAPAIEATQPADLQSGDTANGYSDAGSPDGPVAARVDSPPADGSPDLPPSADAPASQASDAPDVPPVADAASDVPASVCAINGVSYAKKWDPVFSAMGVGADGALWAAGQIYKPFNFASDKQDGGVGLTSTGSSDIFLTRLDPATGLASAQFTFGCFNDDVSSPKSQFASAVAVASGSNVGLIGRFDYEIDFTPNNQDGSGPSGNVGTAGVDFLLGSKNTQFYAVLGGTSSGTYVTPLRAHMIDVGTGALLSVGANPGQNAIAICGKTSKAVPAWNVNGATKGVITGGGAGTAGGGMDIVVAKIDASTGNVVWGKQVGGAGDQICESVTLDSSGNVIIAGNYSGTLNFGGGATAFPSILDGSGDPDTSRASLYVAKLDGTTGDAISAQTWIATGRSDAYSVTTDHLDNIVAAGAIGGNVDFGGGFALTDLGATDAFVVKLSPSLTTLWAKSFGDADFDQTVNSVSTSSAGDVYIGGSFEGSLGALGLTASSDTSTDAFTAQLAGADGSVLCANKYGDALGSQAVSTITVARLAGGNLADWTAIGGSFSNSITLGSTTMNTTSTTVSAAFVARITP